MADLNRMAVLACKRVWPRSSAAVYSRYDFAFSAIALAMCEATDPPTHGELVRAGVAALYAEGHQVQHLRGYGRRPGDSEASASRFISYWAPGDRHRFEEDLIDKLAVRQILDTLTERQQAAVIALATLDD